MFESLHHRDFRLFWAGSLVSNIGTWMQMYALSIVVFSLRRSSFDLGLVGFLSGLPTLFLALPAGASPAAPPPAAALERWHLAEIAAGMPRITAAR